MYPIYLPCPVWHKEGETFLDYLNTLDNVPRVVKSYYLKSNRVKWVKSTNGWDLHIHSNRAERAWFNYIWYKDPLYEPSYTEKTYKEVKTT